MIMRTTPAERIPTPPPHSASAASRRGARGDTRGVRLVRKPIAQADRWPSERRAQLPIEHSARVRSERTGCGGLCRSLAAHVETRGRPAALVYRIGRLLAFVARAVKRVGCPDGRASRRHTASYFRPFHGLPSFWAPTPAMPPNLPP